MDNASLLYRFPLQTSQVTYTSGRNCISIFITPSPLQCSHRPPFTLKLNLPGPYPLIFASGTFAQIFRISVKTPVYVAGLDRGVLPIGDWSIDMTLSRCSSPSILLYSPSSLCVFIRRFERAV